MSTQSLQLKVDLPPDISHKKVCWKRTCLINPSPQTGEPTSCKGLRVNFADDGYVGLKMEGTDMQFCISPEAALQLAEVIWQELLAFRVRDVARGGS